jgi:hypothetical protein
LKDLLPGKPAFGERYPIEGEAKMNPLDSITGTIISGLVLAVVLSLVITAIA